ncbi:head-tail connector protein [Allorhizobium pseudoryzae]|uniref:head-tail connector protein n=1 Tax=Allorhizobium pseudoryzae TaxID=379684 RepID=UPI003D064BB4
MTYAVIEQPGAEPLTLAQVKAHLRVEHAEEDDLLAGLVTVARQFLEAETGVCLMRQRLRLYLDRWPKDGVIQLLRGPVQSLDAVTVYEADGSPVSVPVADHLLDGDSRPSRLWLRDTPQPGQAINGIEIDLTVGFGEAGADVPGPLIRALLIHVAQMYAVRGTFSLDQQPAAVPDGYERLIAGYRMRRL